MARNDPPAAVAARRRVAPAADEATLERVRDQLRKLRDLERERDRAEYALKETNKQLGELRHKTLPELFSEVGIDRLGLPAEGNMPAVDAIEAPFYHANIAADWEPERREAAFKWLEDNGHGDLIRRTFTISFGRGEEQGSAAFRRLLQQAGIPFTEDLGVPWNTLTAFVKEQDQRGETLPLDTLGAVIGRVVKLKERK